MESDVPDARLEKPAKGWAGKVFGALFIGSALCLALAVYAPELAEWTAPPPATTHLHGMSLPVRRWDESRFDASTRRWDLEVYGDNENGRSIYVVDKGRIAVAP